MSNKFRPDLQRRARDIDRTRCETSPGKMRFADRGQAEKRARKSMEGIPGAPPLYVYRCPDCKGWHLTHSVQRDGR